MPVAKSYQELEIVSEIYLVNGRQYVKIRGKNGNVRQVRWYSDVEYARMYPEAKKEKATSPIWKTQKEILGFEKGYITIFKGDTYSHLEWFKKSIARYCRFWGWYIISTEEIPIDLPTDIKPVQLNWELVGNENGNLKNDNAIEKAIEPLLYDAHPSEFQGTIGNRLEKILTIQKALEMDGAYGSNTMHIMEDEDGNVYVWNTASKTWPVGSVKRVRGTVKDHRTYRNCKQTILTRCVEVL